MFLRKSFQEFLILHSEAEAVPLPSQSPRPDPSMHCDHRKAVPSPDRVIDWRWLERRDDAHDGRWSAFQK